MIAIVTATMDWLTARDCAITWMQHARGPITLYVVGQNVNGEGFEGAPQWDEVGTLDKYRMMGYRTKDVLGVVPAFAIGVQKALEDGHEIIACLHDDLDIEDPGWDLLVQGLFKRPEVGLCGFGGGMGLGHPSIYQLPYDPMQLARRQFVSNMRDANAHGARSLQPLRVACLDGFSQIGSRDYWMAKRAPGQPPIPATEQEQARFLLPAMSRNLFEVMQAWGIVHHAYDAALGCFARRLGWETWMLPVACHHYGGRTAVGNVDYQRWANQKGVVRDSRGTMAIGDQGFWLKAHQIVYEQFRDVLPID